MKYRFNLNKETVDLSTKPTKENVYELYQTFIKNNSMDDFIKFWVKIRNLKVYFPADMKLHLIHKDDEIREEEILKLNLLEYTYPLQLVPKEHWVGTFSSYEEADKLKPNGTHIFNTKFIVLYLYYLSFVDKNYVDGITLDPFKNSVIINKINMKSIFSLEMDLLDYFKDNKIYDN